MISFKLPSPSVASGRVYFFQNFKDSERHGFVYGEKNKKQDQARDDINDQRFGVREMTIITRRFFCQECVPPDLLSMDMIKMQ